MSASIIATFALVGALLVPLGASAALADPCGTGSNPITCENSKPGTDPAVWDISGAGDPTIQGFSTDISVNVGSKIDFKIDTPAPNYSIEIYRTGWYQGLGARKIASVTPLQTPQAAQPACITDSTTELYDCGTWAVSASWNVPATAVSGVYVALLKRSDTGGKSHITFVVRNQASRSAVLFQTSDPTWQAYNAYGGSDFYQGAANGRAYKISYNRPIATRNDNDGRDFYYSAEYPLVRFLEKNGYDVSYFSGVDTDRFGSLLTNHKVFLSVGHDEYWSTGQRANVEAARDAGLNLQFLSGNEVYWHTRYEPSADLANTPYRTLVGYKETWSNGKIDPSNTWTGTWRDPRFASPANGGGKPENSLTGTAFLANHDDLAVTVTAAQGKTRMWRNTGLSTMSGASQALAPHTVGYESDEDIDNGFRPSGLVRLSTTVGPTPQLLQDYGNVVVPGTTTHNVTLYRASSGALVFSVGSIQWTWGLDQEHDGNGAAADSRMQQAQVNLLADMGAQPLTLVAPLVAATKSTDTTGPTVNVTSPSAGSTVANGTIVNLAGTATDVGGVVAGVNVSTDNGATWHAATGTTSWTYSYVQHGKGNVPVLIRAADDSGNYTASPKSVTYSVTGPYSVFGLETPKIGDAGDAGAVQLGLRFTATTDGYIAGVRFYKSAANTGVHTGSLWNTSGVRLANVTFPSETASGWQTANFASPVAVTAGTTYVVSYFAPNGHYAASGYHWVSRGSTAAPLTVAGGFGAEPAGVYAAGESTFPTNSFGGSNYYVDAIFETTDTSPVTIVDQRPLANSTSVPPGVTISATYSKDVVASSTTVSVVAAGGGAVAGTKVYTASTRTVTFQPTSDLPAGKKFTVTVTGIDSAGRTVSSGGSWSFTTALETPPAGVCPCSLFTDSTLPSVLQVADSNAVSLGLKFTPSSSGLITAIKFYKSAANTGTHVGTLWSNSGASLATVTFGNESSSGWQTAALSSPVAVTAGTTYVASYRTTVGNYSATTGQFASSYTRGPLSVAANGGVYNYGAGFPTSTSTTSYLVDVVFSPAAEPITLTGTTPAAGATNVLRSSTVIAQLSQPVAPGYSLTVTSGGGPVAGSTTLSGDGKAVVFTPTAALPNGAVVQVSLSGVVSTQGVALAPQAWSFTTVDETTNTVTVSRLFGTETPSVAAVPDDSAPVELGVSFSPGVAGSVTAIRFYKATGNGGAHVGHLWNSSGGLLATVNFVDETASGWQTAQLPTGVALVAGQTYVVSYFAPQGHYSYTSNYFSTPKTGGPLTAGTAANGRYRYSATGGFPTSSWNATNYFVDVEFAVVTPAGPGSAPAVVAEPAATATPTPPGLNLFGAETPADLAVGDSIPIEVGVSFSTSVAGTVTAINFYKGPGNGGAHVGHLWSEAGEPLATVDFTAETDSGWQTAQLATPVALVPGQTYVVSYFAPQGHYPSTSGYFATAKTSGPLTAEASANGRYRYTSTGGFPQDTHGATNYFVDVSFTPTP